MTAVSATDSSVEDARADDGREAADAMSPAPSTDDVMDEATREPVEDHDPNQPALFDDEIPRVAPPADSAEPSAPSTKGEAR